MNIAIDFDDTLTADAKLWRLFCEYAEELGHKVFVVTCRRDTPDNRETVKEWLRMHLIDLHVVYTNLRSKQTVCEERGMRIDVWIDDHPLSILEGR
jgi:5'(3')-deoxyribonucleotidase